MFNKLRNNNKGYMLVEIILAFSIAFILLYFIMDLVIKMKNTNDDLLVKTLVYTDQSIVSNGLMDLITDDAKGFNCGDLEIEGKVIKYNGNVIDIVSDYAEIDMDNYVCKDNVANKIMINIPISVKQLPDENFSIDIDYRYGPNDTEIPVCNFSVDSAGKLTAKCYDVGIEGVEPSGIESYKWDDEEEYTMNEDNLEEITVIKDIDKKEHSIIVIDNAGNKGEFTYNDNDGPICSLSGNNGVISLSSSKDNGSDGNNASGIKSYQWDGGTVTSKFENKNISTTKHVLKIIDYSGNVGTCTYMDISSPTCSLKVSNGVISLSSSKDNGSDGNNASGIKSYQWNGGTASSSSSTKSINGIGEYTLTIKDYAGNSGSCKVTVSNLSTYKYCPNSGSPSTSCYYYKQVITSAAGSCSCSKRINGAGVNDWGTCSYTESSISCSCPSGYQVYTYNCYAGSYGNKIVYQSAETGYTCASGTSSTGNGYCYK